MMDPAANTSETPRWLHGWALLTVCATVCLLLVGAKVTTIKAGMADPDWPTHVLHLFYHSRDSADYVIEHSHRLAGYVVGICTIVLALGLWLTEKRRWVCWLGTAALAGVSLQGVLGGLRVLYNLNLGPVLAAVHACFAQIVFALLVSLVLFTSRWWTSMRLETTEAACGQLRRLTLLTCVVLYGQIVLGAVLRHTVKDAQLRLSQRLHFLGAFAALACVLWLVKAIRDRHTADRRLARLSVVLIVLTTLQLLLGVESWMNRFGSGLPEPAVTIASGMTRTLHFVFGSLTFAASVMLAVLAHQPLPRPASIPAAHRKTVLEGVA